MGGDCAADLRRASHGLVTDWTRTGDGLLMGGHLSDADNLGYAEMGGDGAADLGRTSDGRATDGGRGATATDFDGRRIA